MTKNPPVLALLAVLATVAAAGSADDAVTPARVIPNVDIPEFGSFSSETDGARLYESICRGCHMPDARGAQGAGMYPALAGNPKLVSPAYPAYIVLNGLRGMPAIGQHLTDAQVAAVVNYVITNFGNAAPSLATADEIRALRASSPGAGR